MTANADRVAQPAPPPAPQPTSRGLLPTATTGTMAVDWESRADMGGMRAERLKRLQDELHASDLQRLQDVLLRRPTGQAPTASLGR